MATRYEYYGDSNAGFSSVATSTTWLGLVFTNNEAHTLSLVYLRVYVNGVTPTMTVSIRAVDENDDPTGPDLSTGTFSGPWRSATGRKEAVVMTPVALAPATKYAIAVRSDGDGFRFIGSPGGRAGNARVSTDSGVTWGNKTTGDGQNYCHFKFEEWSTTDPAVTTQAMSDVVTTTATGNGNVTALGDPVATQYGHCWNTTGNPTTSDSKTALGAPGATGAFTSNLTGLTEGTRYYVRSYIITDVGTFYGAQVIFDAGLATVSADAATDVVANSATLNGTLDDDGGEACDCGFEWGETDAYGNTTPTQSRTTGQTFSQSISGLDPATTYHFRAFATNGSGTSYSADRTFTTLGTTSAVTTDPATGVGMVLADLNGTLDDDGGVACDCGFEWGETVAYGNTTSTQSKVTGETFSQAISGLTPGITYHFRASSNNVSGTSYGADRTFTTAEAISRGYALSRHEL